MFVTFFNKFCSKKSWQIIILSSLVVTVARFAIADIELNFILYVCKGDKSIFNPWIKHGLNIIIVRSQVLDATVAVVLLVEKLFD